MTDLELKSLKVYQRFIMFDVDIEDPPLEYENISDDEENNMVISAYTSNYDYYRIVIPYRNFGECGGSVKINWPKNKNELTYLENSKFFLLSKIYNLEFFEMLRYYAKKIGAILVYDLDDNFHEVSPSNYAHEHFNHINELGLQNTASMEYVISNCDHVIYSTRELQAYYKELNPNSSIMPNFLDIDKRYKNFEPVDWRKIANEQEVDYNENSILVGFFGSDSHIEDLEILKEAIMKILNENKNVIFAIMTGPDVINHVLLKNWGLCSKRFIYFRYQNINDYVKYISCFDIGLAPLLNTYFNLCKSNLKLLEYGALSIPYVASKLGNFQRFQVESKEIGGFTCNTSSEWYEKINFLINNPDIRKNMGEALKQYVYNQYDVKHSLVLISNTYRIINETHNKFRKKPTIIDLADSYDNIPKVKLIYCEEDICPCGSGDKYLNCKNNCYPAWGEIVKEEICQSNS